MMDVETKGMAMIYMYKAIQAGVSDEDTKAGLRALWGDLTNEDLLEISIGLLDAIDKELWMRQSVN